eukprot:403357337
MNQSLEVVLLSLGMFVITFAMGFLPSKVNTSQKIMNLIAIFGAGLLVGASLIVIVPEGMLVLFQSMIKIPNNNSNSAHIDANSSEPAQSSTQETAVNQTITAFSQRTISLHAPTGSSDVIIDHNVTSYVGLSLIVGFTVMLMLDQGFLIIQERKLNKEHVKHHELEHPHSVHHHDQHHEKEEKHHHHHKHNEPHNHILENGFKSGDRHTIQNAIHDDEDQNRDDLRKPLLEKDVPCSIKKKRHSRKDSQSCKNVDLNPNQESLTKSTHHVHVHDGDKVHDHFHGGKGNIIVSTIGLVIHSIADGVALGASLYLSSKSQAASSLGLLIFVAVLMHKAPAAIGFGTFLTHEGLRGWELSKYLLAFTLAAPLSSMLGYFSLLFWEEGATDSQQLMFWVGILLLLSAGSFIYVATIHILPEVYCNTDIHRPHTHTHLPEDHVHDEEHYSKIVELITILFGLFVPYLLMMTQSHQH